MVRTKSTCSKIDTDNQPSTSPRKPSGSASRWTPEDRMRLFAYVAKHGAGSWTLAATWVPGKTGQQCQDQWTKRLCPLLRNACATAA